VFRSRALMVLFLMHDQNDPLVDYNAEDYVNPFITNYDLDVNLFKQGTSYLIANIKDGMSEEAINQIVFDSARATNLDLKFFFKRLYQLLFGQDGGPKLSTFIYLYGADDFTIFLKNRLNDPLYLITH
jgi:hypothetical protein